MHKGNCPALDPFAHLLGDYGLCRCGGDDAGVLRLPERYVVETTRSGFERVSEFPSYAPARRFAESEARQIGGPVHIWLSRAAVIQAPAMPPQLDYVERIV